METVSKTVKKTRQVNIELLRILAMLMIIALHYLGKGGTLLPFDGTGFSVNAYVARLLETFAYVSVNIYILISGYFLVDSKFRFEKVIQLWLQVFFYSAGIYLLLLTTGNLPEIYDNTYFRAMFFAPLGMQHNWFPSIYVILYMIFPFLATMVKKISKRQLQACIIILLLIFSKIPNIIYPMSVGFDDRGYGIIWMVCLFMVAGYIKLYVPITGKWGKKLLCYFVFILLTFLSFFVISWIYMTFGKLDNFVSIFYNYNSPTIIIASIALFLAFLNMGKKNKRDADKKNTFFEKTILYVASLTFGIYLIHEHILLRNLWTTLWKVPQAFQEWYFISHFFAVIFAVFVLCGMIEAIRKWIFNYLYKSRIWTWVKTKTVKLNQIMNGEI